MAVESPNELTPENIRRMSPDMAKEALARLQARHTAENPIDYSTQAGQITMTPEQATKMLEGMRPTDAEGRPIPEPYESGIVPSSVLQERRFEEMKTQLEYDHFPARGTPGGDELWAMLDGKTPVSPALEAAVDAKLHQLTNDRDWGRRLLEGDPLARRQFHEATGVKAAALAQRESRLG